MKPSQMNPSLFCWSTWRIGGEFIADLGLVLRKKLITKGGMRMAIRKHTVGYCDGESLMCRPKIGHKAVMLYKDGEHGWFHLRNDEFESIFEDQN